jgi:hypothetical protein
MGFRILVALGIMLASLALACHEPRYVTDGEPLVRDLLRSDLLGCYELFSANGKPLDSSYYNSSPRIQLDSMSLGVTARDTWPGIYRSALRLDQQGIPVDQPDSLNQHFRSWWADSLSDSIRISFSDGHSGTLLVLSAPDNHGDTLHGRLGESWDFAPDTPHGKGKAIHVPCKG